MSPSPPDRPDGRARPEPAAQPRGDLAEGQPSATTAVRMRVRRYPRFSSFLLTGAVLGFVAGVLVDLLGPDQTGYDPVSTLGYFGVFGAALGALVAAVVAVLLDRNR